MTTFNIQQVKQFIQHIENTRRKTPVFSCSKHPDNPLLFYCRKEEEYICAECFEAHKSHADSMFHLRNGDEVIREAATNLVLEIEKVQEQLEYCKS